MTIRASMHVQRATGQSRPNAGFAGWRAVYDFALAVLQAARERRQLAGLDARSLRDLGIDPASARIEAERPPWDLPRRLRDG